MYCNFRSQFFFNAYSHIYDSIDRSPNRLFPPGLSHSKFYGVDRSQRFGIDTGNKTLRQPCLFTELTILAIQFLIYRLGTICSHASHLTHQMYFAWSYSSNHSRRVVTLVILDCFTFISFKPNHRLIQISDTF